MTVRYFSVYKIIKSPKKNNFTDILKILLYNFLLSYSLSTCIYTYKIIHTHIQTYMHTDIHACSRADLKEITALFRFYTVITITRNSVFLNINIMSSMLYVITHYVLE